MSQRRPMLADALCECDRLRRALEVERKARDSAETHADLRAQSIRQLTEAVEILKTRCAELQAQLEATQAEKETYREALAVIESVFHRFGDGCSFGHVHTPTTEETDHV